MKFHRSFFAAVLIAAAFGLNVDAAGAREFVLGHTGQPQITFSQVAQQFADKLKELSKGEMTVSVMGASALGNNREGIEQIQQGMTDFWVISTGLLAQFSNAVSVFDLPYLWKSEEAFIAFAHDPLAMEIVAPLEEKGIKALGYFPQGWRHIHSNVAVRKPEDVKGIKIRTEPAPIRMAIFKAMGANAIPMDFGEVFTSLQQGVIDAGENTIENIESQGFYTVNKYVTLDGHILDPMLLVISKITWDGLSDSEKKAVQEAADYACEWGQKKAFANGKAVIEKFKAAGKPEIIELSAEERTRFREATKSVYDQYVDTVGRDIYNRIVKFQEPFTEGRPES